MVPCRTDDGATQDGQRCHTRLWLLCKVAAWQPKRENRVGNGDGGPNPVTSADVIPPISL